MDIAIDLMRAARFHGAGDIRIEEVPRPADPGPGELLLQIVAAGICGSDALEYLGGPVLVHPLDQEHPVTGHRGPLILGHEFAGEVVAVGRGVDAFSPGMLVVCGAGMSCGSCPPCRAGRTNLCTSYATIGFHRDGGLAELCLAPAAICIEVGRAGLSPRVAALAQPMAIAVHASRRGRVVAGDDVLVIGAGGIGAFLTFAVASAGARVVVVDLDERRLQVATALGADDVVALGGGETLPDALARVHAAPGVVFEVSGSAGALKQAVAVVPRGGRIVVVGVQKKAPDVDFRRVTLDELELIGTVAHVCHEDLPKAVELLASRAGGWDDVAPVVLDLHEVVERGIRPIAEGVSPQIKTLIDPQRGAAPPG
jgi:(R,R)-butanediol dehydrogenase/meso-butanediol dehydrogenase/diacetyl reductase